MCRTDATHPAINTSPGRRAAPYRHHFVNHSLGSMASTCRARVGKGDLPFPSKRNHPWFSIGNRIGGDTLGTRLGDELAPPPPETAPTRRRQFKGLRRGMPPSFKTPGEVSLGDGRQHLLAAIRDRRPFKLPFQKPRRSLIVIPGGAIQILSGGPPNGSWILHNLEQYPS